MTHCWIRWTLPQRIVRCGQSEHCETRISDIVDHGVDGHHLHGDNIP